MKQQEMKTIKVDHLRKGMYVILPLSWHEHPFLKGQFNIKSDAEIEKIKALGFSKIKVDPARYQKIEGRNANISPVERKTAREIVPDGLLTTIQDMQLPPIRKAALVQEHSFTMMNNLLEDPTAENIREAKKGISAIVQLILKDEHTLHYLLNITSHDFYTYTHSVNVGVLAVALAKELFKNQKDHDIHALGAGFFLHDLGKVDIVKDILNKPGKLTEEEMHDIRRHPSLGFKLLHETRQLTDESKIIVLQHHERIDGTGYPKKLCGNEIHIYGRICAIADVYDALTSDRPYRKKMRPFDALKVMREEMMHHFQKDLFEQFVLLFKPPEGLPE